MEKFLELRKWDEMAGYAAKSHCYSESGIFYATFYNLAQAYRGRQVDELFMIPQEEGVQGLMLAPKPGTWCDPILAYELFTMCNMAAAQTVASNNLYSLESGTIDYAMLKMLAKIELMRGQDRVADKYLKILSRQKDYREWAKNARLDPDIERGRRKLVWNDTFSSKGIIRELFDILDADPSDSLAMQYCLSCCLLSKDLEFTSGFIEKYFGSPALKTLPVPAQEALVYYAGYMQTVEGDDSVDMDWCVSLGVSENTFRRFESFMAAVEQDDKWALMNFENTFWYYMMFTEI